MEHTHALVPPGFREPIVRSPHVVVLHVRTVVHVPITRMALTHVPVQLVILEPIVKSLHAAVPRVLTVVHVQIKLMAHTYVLALLDTQVRIVK